MNNYSEKLRDCSLFADIENENLTRMLACLGAKVVEFDRKHTVLAEGNPAKHIGIVLSGSVQIMQIDYYGNRSLLGTAGAGELFCEAFACAQVNSIPVTVVANEKSEIMLIDCGHILHTCSNNCEFHRRLIFNLMTTLAQKNLGYYQKIEIISKRTTRDKLMTYLMLCAKRAGSNAFSIPFDRQELADYLEVDRSGLSAEISKLRKEGVFLNTKKHFELL